MSNILEVLIGLGYQPRDCGKEYRMRPQYRESSNSTSLSVFKDTGCWVDFSIGAKGNLVELIELHSIADVDQWLVDRNFDPSGVVNREPTQQIKIPKKYSKDILLTLTKDYSYWENRGITQQTLEQFAGGVAYKGRLANRYVFPIFNSRSDIIGFAGRDLFNNNEHRPKWKIIGAKTNFVYPAFLLHKSIKDSKIVVIVESVGDALALYEIGIRNVLVCFGIVVGQGITNYLLKTDLHKILICFNQDTKNVAGQTGASKAQAYLNGFFDQEQVEIIKLPYNDCNDYLLKDSQGMRNFFIEYGTAKESALSQ